MTSSAKLDAVGATLVDQRAEVRHVDYVAAFDGASTLNRTRRIGLFCGNQGRNSIDI